MYRPHHTGPLNSPDATKVTNHNSDTAQQGVLKGERLGTRDFTAILKQTSLITIFAQILVRSHNIMNLTTLIQNFVQTFSRKPRRSGRPGRRQSRRRGRSRKQGRTHKALFQ